MLLTGRLVGFRCGVGAESYHRWGGGFALRQATDVEEQWRWTVWNKNRKAAEEVYILNLRNLLRSNIGAELVAEIGKSTRAPAYPLKSVNYRV